MFVESIICAALSLYYIYELFVCVISRTKCRRWRGSRVRRKRWMKRPRWRRQRRKDKFVKRWRTERRMRRRKLWWERRGGGEKRKRRRTVRDEEKRLQQEDDRWRMKKRGGAGRTDKYKERRKRRRVRGGVYEAAVLQWEETGGW